MIISFGNSETEQVWLGNRVKKLPVEIQNTGRRKLRMLNNSVDLADLRTATPAADTWWNEKNTNNNFLLELEQIIIDRKNNPIDKFYTNLQKA